MANNRKTKLEQKRKRMAEHQRRFYDAQQMKLSVINKRLYASVEVVLDRIKQQHKFSDVAARCWLSDLFERHLFINSTDNKITADVPITSVKSKDHSDAGSVLVDNKGFDRKLWALPNERPAQE